MKLQPIKKIAVIGAGSWGTALAKLLADKGEQVLLWSHRIEHVDALRRDRENRKYLPGAFLPGTLQPVHTFEELPSCQCLVMAVPSHGYREVFSQLIPHLQDGTALVSAVKGIEIGTLQTMCEVMEEELARQNKTGTMFTGVLSGPSFADEVAAGQPTAVTVGFAESNVAKAVQHLFSTSFFRVYTSSDTIGLEISAAMKNVIAIAAGISDGLGYGLNTRAALITRGLAEITRLGLALGADLSTFSGLGGLGDLVLTCTGSLSRNRTVGLKLGEGRTLQQTLDEMTMVAEGVKTTKSCYRLAADVGVEMPILEQTYQILYEDKPCRDAVQDLFGRSLKEE
ncbi:MAG: NAD(P)H-dependent glycerol-3-phosphate dehydrogenase [Candidatus Electrothrix aestuarii]|uniref:Glycerol-3-phosphate dehydrogenase [NAD(P)+] n=1 Tax=Candidatus Electrothrix aestuarii TaxID=3062594 RepID=A0AAU8LRQ6_9BACT|nr:NAD(P)H-dependent glycerol-3-phosphate dehydrogenase [Candidatus Electrothrix aestuarii]